MELKSEKIRRELGKHCNYISANPTEKVYFSGNRDRFTGLPLLVLEAAYKAHADFVLTIDGARADWSNITLAAIIYGTTFLIRNGHTGNSILLRKVPGSRHPCEAYSPMASVDS